eukprot:m51a1_g9334 hypothetical protein (472) ;mRNA; f:30028-31746
MPRDSPTTPSPMGLSVSVTPGVSPSPTPTAALLPMEVGKPTSPEGSGSLAKASAVLAARQRRLRFWIKASVAALVISFLVSGFVAGASSLYLKPFWTPLERLHYMKVAVVNADAGFKLGNTSLNLGAEVARGLVSVPILDWKVHDSATTMSELEQGVRRDDYWAAVLIPGNFTAVFAYNYYGIHPSPKYSNPIYSVLDSLKQSTTTSAVDTAIQAVLGKINEAFQLKIHSGAFGPTQKQRPPPPALMASPFTVVAHNTKPLEYFGWYMAPFLTFTFLFVTAMIGFPAVYDAFHMRMIKGKTMHIAIVIGLRLLTFTFLLCILAATMTGFLKAKEFPAAHGYTMIWAIYLLVGHAFAYGMILPLLSWIGPIGIVFSIILLYMQISTCSGAYAYQLLSPGFRHVYEVLPMGRGVQLIRYAAFDTMSEGHGAHVGVMFAWIVIGGAISLAGMVFGRADKNMVRHKKTQSAESRQ